MCAAKIAMQASRLPQDSRLVVGPASFPPDVGSRVVYLSPGGVYPRLPAPAGMQYLSLK
jgi:hypothetical protein